MPTCLKDHLRRASLAFMASSLICATATAQTTLSMGSDYSANTSMGINAEAFSQRVNELTQGDVVVTIRHDIAAANQYRAVESGVIDLASTLSGAMASEIPFFGISSLPAIVRNTQETEQLYRLSRPRYKALLEQQNYQFLFGLPWPSSGLWSRMPINTASDLTGLSIRTFDTTARRTLLRMGADPITLNWQELTDALANDSLQGVLTSASGGLLLDIAQLMPYYAPLNYSMPLNIFYMNQDIFLSLEESQQQALMQASQEIEKAAWVRMKTSLAQSHARLKASGVHINEPLPDDLRRAMESASKNVVDSWGQKVSSADQALLRDFMESRP